MECPRCGGELTTFTLDGNRAVVCEACEYVGVPADHHVEPREGESWDEALERFHGGDGEDGQQENERDEVGTADDDQSRTEPESSAG